MTATEPHVKARMEALLRQIEDVREKAALLARELAFWSSENQPLDAARLEARGLENELCAQMTEENEHPKLARKMRVDFDRRKLNAS